MDEEGKEELYEKERWKKFQRGEEEPVETVTCPACGRETSSRLKKCEHCTSHQKNRWSVKGVIAVGLALLLVSSIFLTLGVVHEEPVLRVEELSEEHSFRTVRLKGKVVETDYREFKYSEYGRLEMTIFDGTGLCTVYIDKEIMEFMVEKEKIPYVGDEVDIKGEYTGSGVEPTTYNGEEVVVADGSVGVSDVDLFSLDRGDHASFELEEVSTADNETEGLEENTKAELQGFVGDYRELSSGDGLFYLYTGPNYVPVMVPHYSLELCGGWDEDLSGEMVTVKGTLAWYQPYWYDEGGDWELIANGVNNIRSSEEDLSYDARDIEELSSASQDSFTEGSLVRITGSYESFSNVSSGELLALHEGPSSVTAKLPWYTKAVRERRKELMKGDIVEIEGRLSWYSFGEGGEWEVIPDGPESINVVGEREYERRDIGTLLDDPESYEYDYVSLEDVVVSSITWNEDDHGNYYTLHFYVQDPEEENGSSLNIYIDHWEGRLTDLEEGDTLDIQGLFKPNWYEGEKRWQLVIRDDSRDEIVKEEVL
ncbi:MAG: hypothetical protein ACOC55_00775 [Candidatus Natronoplasma sp.]